MRAYDPLTGKEIWRVRYDEGFSNVPRPVFGHGLVFITTGFQQPELLAVRPDGKGDVTKTHVAWSLKRGAPLTPSPILVGDELYIVNDGGIASCIDARTGQRDLAEPARRHLLGVAGFCRWPPVLSRRARRDDRDRAGQGSAAAGDEPAGRRSPGVDGRRRRLVLHADRLRALPDQRASAVRRKRYSAP